MGALRVRLANVNASGKSVVVRSTNPKHNQLKIIVEAVAPVTLRPGASLLLGFTGILPPDAARAMTIRCDAFIVTPEIAAGHVRFRLRPRSEVTLYQGTRLELDVEKLSLPADFHPRNRAILSLSWTGTGGPEGTAYTSVAIALPNPLALEVGWAAGQGPVNTSLDEPGGVRLVNRPRRFYVKNASTQPVEWPGRTVAERARIKIAFSTVEHVGAPGRAEAVATHAGIMDVRLGIIPQPGKRLAWTVANNGQPNQYREWLLECDSPTIFEPGETFEVEITKLVTDLPPGHGTVFVIYEGARHDAAFTLDLEKVHAPPTIAKFDVRSESDAHANRGYHANQEVVLEWDTYGSTKQPPVFIEDLTAGKQFGPFGRGPGSYRVQLPAVPLPRYRMTLVSAPPRTPDGGSTMRDVTATIDLPVKPVAVSRFTIDPPATTVRYGTRVNLVYQVEYASSVTIEPLPPSERSSRGGGIDVGGRVEVVIERPTVFSLVAQGLDGPRDAHVRVGLAPVLRHPLFFASERGIVRIGEDLADSVLVPGERNITDICVAFDRLWWGQFDPPQLQSIKLDGNDRQRHHIDGDWIPSSICLGEGSSLFLILYPSRELSRQQQSAQFAMIMGASSPGRRTVMPLGPRFPRVAPTTHVRSCLTPGGNGIRVFANCGDGVYEIHRGDGGGMRDSVRRSDLPLAESIGAHLAIRNVYFGETGSIRQLDTASNAIRVVESAKPDPLAGLTVDREGNVYWIERKGRELRQFSPRAGASTTLRTVEAPTASLATV